MKKIKFLIKKQTKAKIINKTISIKSLDFEFNLITIKIL